MSLISPNFDVKSIIFPQFLPEAFPQIAGKSPGRDKIHTGGTAMGAASQLPGGVHVAGYCTHNRSYT